MKQPTLTMKFAFIIALALLIMQTAIIVPVIGAMQYQGTVNETPAGRTGGFGGLLH